MNDAEYISALRAALTDCANELEAEIIDRYRGTLDYPSQRRRYDRDMVSVLTAKRLLAERN